MNISPWGYLQFRVYMDTPRTSEQLKRAIIMELGLTLIEMVDISMSCPLPLAHLVAAQGDQPNGTHIERVL